MNFPCGTFIYFSNHKDLEQKDRKRGAYQAWHDQYSLEENMARLLLCQHPKGMPTEAFILFFDSFEYQSYER